MLANRRFVMVALLGLLNPDSVLRLLYTFGGVSRLNDIAQSE